MQEYVIRRAAPTDIPVLIEFNRKIARETENKELKRDVLADGVTALFEHPEYGFYLVAEADGEVVGTLMITKEWSDWRNGLFWWVQSVYVDALFRRRGIYRALYQHAKELAAIEPGVCGFRLYVERENTIAQAVYRAQGMAETAYLLYEELNPGVDYLE